MWVSRSMLFHESALDGPTLSPRPRPLHFSYGLLPEGRQDRLGSPVEVGSRINELKSGLVSSNVHGKSGQLPDMPRLVDSELKD